MSGTTERRADLDRKALHRVVAASYARFATDHWDRAPLLSTGRLRAGEGMAAWDEDDPGRFGDLFSFDAADELLSTRGLRTPFLRLAKDGAVIPAARFTASGGVGATIGDQVDADDVARLFADGATVVFQALHRTWPALVEFTAALTSDVGHPVQVNGYLTPPTAQGFAAHYDTHDVFVVQVGGRKTWTLHRPVLERPWPDEPSDVVRAEIGARAAQPPYLETELGPGDSLYLPRGWLHSARAGHEPTLHLTFGVHPVTVRDVLTAAVEEALRDDRAREALPLGLRSDDPATHGNAHKAVAQVLADRAADVADEAGLVGHAVSRRLARDTRPEPVRPVAQATAVRELHPESVVRPRRHLDVHVVTESDRIGLEVAGRRLSLPDGVDVAALKIALGGPVSARDLPGDPTAAMALLLLLVQEAVLVPAD